jgi:two-component system NarL family sensor kinase
VADEEEEKLIRSVALQNAQAVLRARERAERELIAAKEALERKSDELSEAQKELEKRVEERTAELNVANKELRDLSSTLLQMRDQEQRRLARELHDSVGQLVVAIGMNIAVVNDESHNLSPRAARCISENDQLLRELNRQIRTISHLLHPPLLDESGLESALQWYTQEFAERSKIKVNLEIPADFGRLSNDPEIAIFRIVQECLTNIHRHSGSATATIRIMREASNLVVQVEDAGKGIPEDKQLELMGAGRSGVGFRGMRERLRQLGGTLRISSNENGTTVIATLPVNRSLAST